MKDINWRKILSSFRQLLLAIKKKSWYKILDFLWRFLVAIVLGASFSFLLFYGFFRGNEDLNELLFSEKADISLFWPVFVAWLLGGFVGAVLTFWLFVEDLRDKDYQIELIKDVKNSQIEALKKKKDSQIIALKKEIVSLKTKLGMFKKEEAVSYADRVFATINDPSLESSDADESNGTSADNGTDFPTLQDYLREVRKRENQEPQSPQGQDSGPESQAPKASEPKPQEPKDSKPVSKVSEDSQPDKE